MPLLKTLVSEAESVRVLPVIARILVFGAKLSALPPLRIMPRSRLEESDTTILLVPEEAVPLTLEAVLLSVELVPEAVKLKTPSLATEPRAITARVKFRLPALTAVCPV